LMLEEMSDEEIEELVMKVIDDMIETGKLMPGEGEEEDEEDLEDIEDLGDEETEIEDETEDEDVELEELLNELLGEESTLNEAMPDWLITLAQYANMSPSDLTATLGLSIPGGMTAAAFIKYLADLNKEKKAAKKGTAETIEMEETINELRNELNEVNLLNAKLLYTNKIFKAKNLTESEKVKVLNTFDKAETVKEVKLVFETLTESFVASAKKAPIKESLGSASRSIAPTQAKQPIIEVNDAFARMQRLAGLKK